MPENIYIMHTASTERPSQYATDEDFIEAGGVIRSVERAAAAVVQLNAPYETMPEHLSEANPHDQYILKTELNIVARTRLELGDLLDVNTNEAGYANKVLAYVSSVWKPMNVDELVTPPVYPLATTEIRGLVRLATLAETEDLASTNISAAVTPDTLRSYTSHYINGPGFVPSKTNPGLVKIVKNDDEIAAVITDGKLDSDIFDGTVAQVKEEQFTNVRVDDTTVPALAIHAIDWNGNGRWYEYWSEQTVNDVPNYHWSNNAAFPRTIVTLDAIPYVSSLTLDETSAMMIDAIEYTPLYYKTYATPVSKDTDAEELGPTVYNVYSNGVMSGRLNVNNTSTIINIHKGGIAYDISDCATTIVQQEGTIKRYTAVPQDGGTGNVPYLSDDQVAWLYIYGTAHNVNVSCEGWLVNETSTIYRDKCIASVASHGHLEYAQVESAGAIICGSQGVVEHVTVRNTASNDNMQTQMGLTIFEGGSGYDIALTGAYARAMIYQGKVEDVVVNSNCYLEAVSATLKNVILHEGATLRATNTKVYGLIQYPGAIVNVDRDCVILGRTTGHEPDKVVSLVTSVDVVITTTVIDGVTKENLAATYTFIGDISVANLPYSTALLMENAVVVTSSGGTVEPPGIGDGIELYSVDAPRGFVRIDTLCATSLDRGLIPANSRVECLTSAYQYQDVRIKSCIKGTFLDSNNTNPDHYYLYTPEHMYDEVMANTSVTWRIIF